MAYDCVGKKIFAENSAFILHKGNLNLRIMDYSCYHKFTLIFLEIEFHLLRVNVNVCIPFYF